MTIRVSDLGITRYNSYNGDSTKVGYVNINERLNKSPVQKVDAVSSSTSNQRSVAKEAGEQFVSSSTPAYSVGFTSQGMTALKSFKAARDSLKARNESKTKLSFDKNTGQEQKSGKIKNYKQAQAIKAYDYQMSLGKIQ